jgi:hypothetical protein
LADFKAIEAEVIERQIASATAKRQVAVLTTPSTTPQPREVEKTQPGNQLGGVSQGSTLQQNAVHKVQQVTTGSFPYTQQRPPGPNHQN